MSNINVLFIILGTGIGVITSVAILLPLLKKKGINADDILKKADTAIDGADGVIQIADKIIPNNPAINILKVVEKYAKIGVGQAEQMYIASNLNGDERNTKAKDTVYTALDLMGIQKTPQIEKIIDGTVEAEVLALGHKETDNTPKKIVIDTPTEASKTIPQ